MIEAGIDKFRNALLQGDRVTSRQLVLQELETDASIKKVYEYLIKPPLYQIGRMWEYNQVSVASEHLASAIVEGVLNEVYTQVVARKKNNKRVIVACVQNEYHQIGPKMVSDIFEVNQWNSFFLGANTPTKELITYIETVRPNVLAISMSLYFHLPQLHAMLRIVQLNFPSLDIVVGGQAFERGGCDSLASYKNVNYLRGLNELEVYIGKYTSS